MTIATSTQIDASTTVTVSQGPDTVGQVSLVLLWVVMCVCIAYGVSSFFKK